GSRPLRVAADVGLALICGVFLNFDGLWVLPAVLAFALLDILMPTAAGSTTPGSAGLELLFAGLTVLAAAALTVGLANAAVYSYEGTTTTSSGEVTTTQGTYGLPVATGLVFFILPSALVVWGAFLDW